MEENLKKALSELLVLALLHQREYYALELAPAMAEHSGGAITITFPYAILYRMIEQGYIQELPSVPRRMGGAGSILESRRPEGPISRRSGVRTGGSPPGWTGWCPVCWGRKGVSTHEGAVP